MDVQKICRLCSCKLREPKNIFATPGLLEKILKFTDIQIRQGDGLPCFVCDLCDTNLQNSDRFRRQVGRADKLIRAFVLEQAEQLSEVGALSFEKEIFSKNSDPKWVENDFRPQSDDQGGICREKMRVFEKCSSTNEFPEGFSTSSSIVSSDNERGERDERAVRFAAARRRLRREKRNMRKYLTGKKSPKNITCRTVEDCDLSATEQGFQDLSSVRVPADPLNLLKIRRVQPLVDEASDSSVDSFGGNFTSGTVTWQRGDQIREAHGYRGSAEEIEDSSSPGYNSSSRSNSTVKSSRHLTGSGFNRFASVATPNAKSTKNAEAIRNQGSAVQCPVCERICASVHGFKVHVWTHWSAKCQICEAPTKTKRKFKNHMQLHVKPMESHTFIKCGLCRMVFKTNDGLIIHMRVHSTSVPAMKQCPHCARKFGTLRGFRIHVAKSHVGFESE